MRIRRFSFALVAFLLTAAPAWSQPNVTFRGSVGAADLRGPTLLAEISGSGYDVGLGVGVDIAPYLELAVDGHYARFPLNRDAVAIDIAESSGAFLNQIDVERSTTDALDGTVSLRLFYPGGNVVEPYVRAGLGTRYFRQQSLEWTIDGEPSGIASSTALHWGYDVGAGVSFEIAPKYAFFAETRLVVMALGEAKRTNLLNAERRVSYWPFRIGLAWSPWNRPSPDDDDL